MTSFPQYKKSHRGGRLYAPLIWEPDFPAKFKTRNLRFFKWQDDERLRRLDDERRLRNLKSQTSGGPPIGKTSGGTTPRQQLPQEDVDNNFRCFGYPAMLKSPASHIFENTLNFFRNDTKTAWRDRGGGILDEEQRTGGVRSRGDEEYREEEYGEELQYREEGFWKGLDDNTDVMTDVVENVSDDNTDGDSAVENLKQVPKQVPGAVEENSDRGSGAGIAKRRGSVGWVPAEKWASVVEKRRNAAEKRRKAAEKGREKGERDDSTDINSTGRSTDAVTDASTDESTDEPTDESTDDSEKSRSAKGQNFEKGAPKKKLKKVAPKKKVSKKFAHLLLYEAYGWFPPHAVNALDVPLRRFLRNLVEEFPKINIVLVADHGAMRSSSFQPKRGSSTSQGKQSPPADGAASTTVSAAADRKRVCGGSEYDPRHNFCRGQQGMSTNEFELYDREFTPIFYFEAANAALITRVKPYSVEEECDDDNCDDDNRHLRKRSSSASAGQISRTKSQESPSPRKFRSRRLEVSIQVDSEIDAGKDSAMGTQRSARSDLGNELGGPVTVKVAADGTTEDHAASRIASHAIASHAIAPARTATATTRTTTAATAFNATHLVHAQDGTGRGDVGVESDADALITPFDIYDLLYGLLTKSGYVGEQLIQDPSGGHNTNSEKHPRDNTNTMSKISRNAMQSDNNNKRHQKQQTTKSSEAVPAVKRTSVKFSPESSRKIPSELDVRNMEHRDLGAETNARICELFLTYAGTKVPEKHVRQGYCRRDILEGNCRVVYSFFKRERTNWDHLTSWDDLSKDYTQAEDDAAVVSGQRAGTPVHTAAASGNASAASVNVVISVADGQYMFNVIVARDGTSPVARDGSSPGTNGDNSGKFDTDVTVRTRDSTGIYRDRITDRITDRDDTSSPKGPVTDSSSQTPGPFSISPSSSPDPERIKHNSDPERIKHNSVTSQSDPDPEERGIAIESSIAVQESESHAVQRQIQESESHAVQRQIQSHRHADVADSGDSLLQLEQLKINRDGYKDYKVIGLYELSRYNQEVECQLKRWKGTTYSGRGPVVKSPDGDFDMRFCKCV